MRRDDCRLQNIEFVGKITNRLEKLLRVLNKSNDNADCQKFTICRNSRQNLITAEPDNDRHADRADKINHRIKNRVIINRFDIGVAVIVIDVGKTILGAFFRIKKLNGLRAGNIFLQKCVEFCIARPNFVETFAGAFAKPIRRGK